MKTLTLFLHAVFLFTIFCVGVSNHAYTAPSGDTHPGYGPCGSTLDVRVRADANTVVWVNEIPVTGERSYPLEVVLEALGIDEPFIEQNQGKSFVSVGEGTSNLLPYLLQKGINIRGLDPAYHLPSYPDNENGRLLARYVDFWGAYLIKGSAFKMPFADNSLDGVFSHHFINNLVDRRTNQYHYDSMVLVLDEILRVLKPGKAARIFTSMLSYQVDPLIKACSAIARCTSRSILLPDYESDQKPVRRGELIQMVKD